MNHEVKRVKLLEEEIALLHQQVSLYFMAGKLLRGARKAGVAADSGQN